MIIQKRLIQITCIVVLLLLTSLFGLYQIAKGAELHQRNVLHLQFTNELHEMLELSKTTHKLDIIHLKSVISNIREQPLFCIQVISFMDRLIMRIIGTEEAVKLCIADVKVADDILNEIDTYNNGLLNMKEIRDRLFEAAATFEEHSTSFSKPMTDTVNLIISSTFIIFISFSIIVFLLIVYAVRGISASVKSIEESAKALEESERLNRELAHFDSLTGLPNRNLFKDRLEQKTKIAVRTNKNLAFLYIDIDHFKKVNDSMGHYAGDDLICAASARIQSCLRDTDTVARIGGDEFNVILSELSAIRSAKLVANKILSSLSEPFTILGKKVFISGSIGISIYPNDTQNVEDLKRYADLAMYDAKDKGRNRFSYYSETLHNQVKDKLKIEEHLRNAIRKDELFLQYQPIVSLNESQIVGAEALLRWNNPELGSVSPVNFIPIAEESRLINEIGEWTFKKACEQLQQWRKKDNSKFQISVNVSPIQLENGDFANTVKNILNSYQLPSDSVKIEITEGLIIEEDSTSVTTLKKLSDMGIILLLDDFGTGHSSLSYLHKLPFHVLKIDRSFVTKLDSQAVTNSIVPSIIAMAHKLDLAVIAEGVETQEGLDALLDLNCEYAQGYYFDKPLNSEEIDCKKTYSHLFKEETKTYSH